MSRGSLDPPSRRPRHESVEISPVRVPRRRRQRRKRIDEAIDVPAHETSERSAIARSRARETHRRTGDHCVPASFEPPTSRSGRSGLDQFGQRAGDGSHVETRAEHEGIDRGWRPVRRHPTRSRASSVSTIGGGPGRLVGKVPSPSATVTSSTSRHGAHPSLRSRLGPADAALRTEPGTAITVRPRSSASRTVCIEPPARPLSTTTRTGDERGDDAIA